MGRVLLRDRRTCDASLSARWQRGRRPRRIRLAIRVSDRIIGPKALHAPMVSPDILCQQLSLFSFEVVKNFGKLNGGWHLVLKQILSKKVEEADIMSLYTMFVTSQLRA